MSQKMRSEIDKTKNILSKKSELTQLKRKYDKVVFSDDFYKQDENLIKYQEKLYLKKIDDFIDFYQKYNTKGERIINGRDVYEDSKVIFDKVVSGEIYIDEVFKNPDNPLRNIVLLMHLDEPSLKRKLIK